MTRTDGLPPFKATHSKPHGVLLHSSALGAKERDSLEVSGPAYCPSPVIGGYPQLANRDRGTRPKAEFGDCNLGAL